MTNEEIEKSLIEQITDQLLYVAILLDEGYTKEEAETLAIFLKLEALNDILYGKGV